MQTDVTNIAANSYPSLSKYSARCFHRRYSPSDFFGQNVYSMISFDMIFKKSIYVKIALTYPQALFQLNIELWIGFSE